MNGRKIESNYKGITVTSYKGSNYHYIGNRPFQSSLSVKRHITKVLRHFDGCVKKAREFYGQIESN